MGFRIRGLLSFRGFLLRLGENTSKVFSGTDAMLILMGGVSCFD